MLGSKVRVAVETLPSKLLVEERLERAGIMGERLVFPRAFDEVEEELGANLRVGNENGSIIGAGTNSTADVPFIKEI